MIGTSLYRNRNPNSMGKYIYIRFHTINPMASALSSGDVLRQSILQTIWTLIRLLLEAFLSSTDFFSNKLFQKVLSAITSEFQTVWIQIRSNILLGPDLGQNYLHLLSEGDTSR